MFYRLPREIGSSYSPLYFLASLGAGGLSISFFMWLMFWTPHPETPVPLLGSSVGLLASGALQHKLAVAAAWAGIVVFAALHLQLLLWNIRQYRAYRRTQAYVDLRKSNAETQLLAAPLTIAMSINVLFVLGMCFVPGLWRVVEWLFPPALVAFLAVGVWALSQLTAFWGRVLTEGGFDCAANNSLAQLLPSFALAMVGVGLAAPAAMSRYSETVTVSLLLSSFFVVTALILGAIQLVPGFRAMLEQRANPSTAPTLWIVVPILTVISITLLRQTHGIESHLTPEAGGVAPLEMLTHFLSAQIAFFLLGWVVLKRYGYFARFVTGTERSPGAYALVCPGVALAVMLHFFINAGLARNGLIDWFGAVYWGLTMIALAFQIGTIWLLYRLNRLHFGRLHAKPDGEPLAATRLR